MKVGAGIFGAMKGKRERLARYSVQRPSPRTMTVGQDQDMTKWSRFSVRGGDGGGAREREREREAPAGVLLH
jgi:hypothetical protein